MSLKQTADALLEAAVSNGDVPGVVAAVTTADDTIYEAGFGERAIGGGVAMTPDTVGWIASMTKAVTGTAAMQLVEQGKLDLDAPAGNVVAHLGEVEVLEGFENGEPKMRAPRRPVTLRHLLTHTAGFTYETWNPDILTYQEAKGLPPLRSCENAALLTPLCFDPGERWAYGINLDWVGKMVEAVSGQRLGAYLAANICEPLGMTSTAFKITPDMKARLAAVHARGDDGGVELMGLIVEQNPEFELGGGGLYSTVGDYLKFIRMILNHGSANGAQILKPETVEMMSVNQMGDCRVVELKTAMPAYSNDAEFFPGIEKSWGLSFMINEEEAPTGRSAGSLAWAGLANSYYWIDPTKGIGGAFMTQILPFVDVKAAPLYFDFETAVYRSLST
jgi:CubicO group peptidase (beta-lactamase class C family)